MKAGVTFTGDALEDFAYWVKKDARTADKIIKLIEAIGREPFSGIGKPEPLKHELSGYWSRRINLEHRLVYCIKDDAVVIIQCRYHYQ